MKNTFTNNVLKTIAFCSLTFALVSCATEEQSPGLEYMPDMYRTRAMEPYAKNEAPIEGNNFSDSMEARLPANGTISRNFLPYGIPNSNEGYEMAGELLKNPYPKSEEIIAEGKVIYTKMCLHCHGKEGAGDGLTVTAGGHPPPPAYNSAALKNLSEGKMFHTITYGKNLMGAHASQLNVEERWQVIRYVQTLQNPDEDSSEETTTNGETGTDQELPAESAEMADETAMNN